MRRGFLSQFQTAPEPMDDEDGGGAGSNSKRNQDNSIRARDKLADGRVVPQRSRTPERDGAKMATLADKLAQKEAVASTPTKTKKPPVPVAPPVAAAAVASDEEVDFEDHTEEDEQERKMKKKSASELPPHPAAGVDLARLLAIPKLPPPPVARAPSKAREIPPAVPAAVVVDANDTSRQEDKDVSARALAAVLAASAAAAAATATLSKITASTATLSKITTSATTNNNKELTARFHLPPIADEAKNAVTPAQPQQLQQTEPAVAPPPSSSDQSMDLIKTIVRKATGNNPAASESTDSDAKTSSAAIQAIWKDPKATTSAAALLRAAKVEELTADSEKNVEDVDGEATDGSDDDEEQQEEKKKKPAKKQPKGKSKSKAKTKGKAKAKSVTATAESMDTSDDGKSVAEEEKEEEDGKETTAKAVANPPAIQEKKTSVVPVDEVLQANAGGTTGAKIKPRPPAMEEEEEEEKEEKKKSKPSKTKGTKRKRDDNDAAAEDGDDGTQEPKGKKAKKEAPPKKKKSKKGGQAEEALQEEKTEGEKKKEESGVADPPAAPPAVAPIPATKNAKPAAKSSAGKKLIRAKVTGKERDFVQGTVGPKRHQKAAKSRASASSLIKSQTKESLELIPENAGPCEKLPYAGLGAPGARRCARRGGVKRVSTGSLEFGIRCAIEDVVKPALRYGAILVEHDGRKTMSLMDIVRALRRINKHLYTDLANARELARLNGC